jgi:two-component system, LuxR family, response regulator DctR
MTANGTTNPMQGLTQGATLSSLNNAQTSNPIKPNSAIAVLVDDEDVTRDALAWLLKSRGVQSQGFRDGQSFLSWLEVQPAGLAACIVLDVRMLGLSGIEVFNQMLERQLHSSLPVIFLTAHGDVPMAVDALKQGAFDFFLKPFTDNSLADRILEALNTSQKRLSEGRSAAQTQSRLETLTDREKAVMDLIVAGRLNKIIADDLGISMRTVEVHRARIFAKMGVRSAVELTNLLSKN